jgi:hypothetical protein
MEIKFYPRKQNVYTNLNKRMNMKITILIAIVFCVGTHHLSAQVSSPTPIQVKVTALNQKYPLLFDTNSTAREAKCVQAVGQLKDDAELAALKTQLDAARNASVSDSAKIVKLSQDLQKKQFEKIAGLYPELQTYLEAKANHQKERLALMKEYANDLVAYQAIVDGTKQKKQ